MKYLLKKFVDMVAPVQALVVPNKMTVKLLKYITWMSITFLSIIGLVELPGVVYPLLWRCVGLPVPFASAYYHVNISNLTGQDMAFTVLLINDRNFEPPSDWRERTDLRMGWRWSRDVVIADKDSTTIQLPSYVDPRLGIVMIVGRTAVRSDSPPVRQGIGMKFLTWPWRDGGHMWRDNAGEWPVMSCAFDYHDVFWMKGDSNDPEGPIVPVLRGMLKTSLDD